MTWRDFFEKNRQGPKIRSAPEKVHPARPNPKIQSTNSATNPWV
jgi:hypothetical protein